MEVLTSRYTEQQERIRQLLKQKNATLLAHYYQRPEIQEIADFVGDSLELAKRARVAVEDTIVFSGVYFMAETAKILNPSKTVLVPDPDAGCSLADSAPAEAFKAFIDQYPNHEVVCYINCNAEVKALCDQICTSSNAEAVIRSIPADKPIIFAPDKNLGAYLSKITGREMVLWDGVCMVHDAFSLEKLIRLSAKYPDAPIVAHPESDDAVLKIANFIGSTSKMIDYIKHHPAKQFIVGTEAGILHQLAQVVDKDVQLIPVPSEEDNTCSCSECAFMKMNTLDKIEHILLTGQNEVILEEQLMQQALKPLMKMLQA